MNRSAATRDSRQRRLSMRLMRVADRGTQLAYGLTGGRLGERQLGYSILLLHTAGRKTGRIRTHALLYVRDGKDFVVCASNFGSSRHPAWYLNLQASGAARIQVGPAAIEVTARTAGAEERARLWPKFLAVRPQYADYQAATARQIPLVVLTPIPAGGQRQIAMATYIFDPQVIHSVALQHLGPPSAERFNHLIESLAARYPGQIHGDQPWIFSNAGGVMIQMKLLHASLNEYVLIWGTAIGTEGHTGRNPVEYYDTVLHGEAWYFREGRFERDVYRPGDLIVVGKRESAGIRIDDAVWMVEYARGPVWRLLPFGLADSLFSTLDFATVARTLRIYMDLSRRNRRTSPHHLTQGARR